MQRKEKKGREKGAGKRKKRRRALPPEPLHHSGAPIDYSNIAALPAQPQPVTASTRHSAALVVSNPSGS